VCGLGNGGSFSLVVCYLATLICKQLNTLDFVIKAERSITSNHFICKVVKSVGGRCWNSA